MISIEGYVSLEHARREWSAVFERTWLLVCHRSRLGERGATTSDLGRTRVLVVAGPGGEARGFVDACPVGGGRLEAIGLPRGAVACRHGGTWTLDGAATGRCDAPLVSVRVGSAGGYLWASLGREAPSLETYLGTLPALIDRLGLGDYTLTRDLSIEVDCNWKVLAEAFNEGYHVPSTHPELADLIDFSRAHIAVDAHHNQVLQPLLGLRPGETMGPALAGMLAELGVDAKATPREGLVSAVRARIEAMGWDTSALDDDTLTQNYTINVFPNVSFSGLLSHRHFLSRFRPHPVDPERSIYDFQELIRLPRRQTQPAPVLEHLRYGERSVSTTIDQDLANCVAVQAGLRSHAVRSRGIVLGALERGVAHLHETLGRYLAAPSPG